MGKMVINMYVYPNSYDILYRVFQEKRNTLFFYQNSFITNQLSKYLVSMDALGSQLQFDTNHGLMWFPWTKKSPFLLGYLERPLAQIFLHAG